LASTQPNPPLPPELLKGLAAQLGMTVPALQQYIASHQQTSTNTWDPFSLDQNIETGTLFKGMQAGATTGPTWYLENAPGMGMRWYASSNAQMRSVLVAGLNLPAGWHAEFVPQGGQDDNAIRIQDNNGKVRQEIALTPDQRAAIMASTPGSGEAQMSPIQRQQAGEEKRGPIGPHPGSHTFQPKYDYTLQLTPDQIGAIQSKQTPIEGSIKDELTSLYSTAKSNPQQMRAWKHELWAAGYYGRGTKLDEIDMNTLGTQDMAAFGSLFADAARYYAAGQNVTWQDLLKLKANSPNNLDALTKGAKTYRLSDPATIIEEANATATKILGRGPSPEDVQTLLKSIETQEQNKKAAVEAGGGFYQGTDPTADIAQYFRQKYPNEAMSTDVNDRVTAWRDLLKTPPAGSAPAEVTPRGVQL